MSEASTGLGQGLAPAPSARQRLQARARVTITERDSLAQAIGDDSGLAGQLQAGQGPRQQRISSVEHTHSPLVTVYDPHGNARQVPAMNLNMVLDSGLEVLCPLCGGQHTDDGPNQCPARERLLLTRCPVCRRVIPEERVGAGDAALEGADGLEDGPDFVRPRLPDRASREQQLQARLEQHLLAYHPSEAFSRYGLRKPGAERE